MSDHDAVRRTIAVVLAAAGGGAELLDQLRGASLDVSASEVLIRPSPSDTAAVGVADGPLDVTADVTGADGEYLGEILVWVRDGRLSSAEYAWVTDRAPSAWPEPDSVAPATW